MSETDTDINSLSQRTYIRDDGNNQENLSSNGIQKNTSGLFKLSSTFTPSAKWYVNYDGFLKFSNIDDQNGLTSDFTDFSNSINSLNVRRPFSIEQSFNAYYAKDDNNVFSLETNYLYKLQRPQYDLLTTQQPFISVLPTVGQGSL